ncbi:putative transporter [Pseudonocardia sp. Ae168_Ps1]|nr:putative transporter [Pseudonocardia sp. Ae168_Ps1]OLL77250.1 putative transporter [Pseudonocardia sp. Ae150A_Ps1]OLL88641.1 putative transporter [Pseudonocardia sp. Ae263_Ps1]OLL91338.1 putative transporter [Pseudonocardia sp. Ae356_Ps1]
MTAARDGSPPRPQIGLLLAAVFLVFLGQMTLNPVIAPLSREVGLAEWQVGVTISTAALMVVLTSQSWGRRSQSWGRKPVLVGALALATTSMALFALVAWSGTTGAVTGTGLFVLFVLLRGLGFGTAIAAVPPTAQAYVADVTADERARVKGMAGIGAVQGVAMVGGLGRRGRAVGVRCAHPAHRGPGAAGCRARPGRDPAAARTARRAGRGTGPGAADRSAGLAVPAGRVRHVHRARLHPGDHRVPRAGPPGALRGGHRAGDRRDAARRRARHGARPGGDRAAQRLDRADPAAGRGIGGPRRVRPAGAGRRRGGDRRRDPARRAGARHRDAGLHRRPDPARRAGGAGRAGRPDHRHLRPDLRDRPHRRDRAVRDLAAAAGAGGRGRHGRGDRLRAVAPAVPAGPRGAGRRRRERARLTPVDTGGGTGGRRDRLPIIMRL